MTHLKFPDQVESEIHQTLGAEKIEEICDRYFLGEIGRIILGKILLRITLNDLLRNKKQVSKAIAEESGDYWHKETIEKIISVIAELFVFARKRFWPIQAGG